MEVYVVRHFFESCNDTNYTGVFDDFFKAAAAILKEATDDYSDYSVKFGSPYGSDEVWVTLEDEIYYTITRMPVQ
jgi:hypothetical protein